MSRPYFHHTTAELHSALEKARGNRAELESLAKELESRSTKSSRELRDAIRAAIDGLSKKKAKPTAPPTAGTSLAKGLATTETTRSNALQHDHSQLAVVEAESDARLLVDAGPGTGKTAVACRRVAHLIAGGVEPANMWLVSFTRTAVHEIRNRIKELSRTEGAAIAVKIFTLDSQAWQLVYGLANNEKDLFADYGRTIDKAIALLRNPTEEALEYFGSVEHLIVDEAQDLVGNRADLVEMLIRTIPNSAGVTVLCDEAQAIYGFAEEDASPDSVPLTTRIRSGSCGAFDCATLTEIHRTESPGLLRIFGETRQRVLSPATSSSERFMCVREDIAKYADGETGDILDQGLQDKPDTLVLFRRRVEVLRASSYLSSENVAHRVRMSGMPSYIPAWVAGVLWDHEDRWLQERDFATRLGALPRHLIPMGVSSETLWHTLVKLAGTSAARIDLRRLRQKLSMTPPPVELSVHEVGDRGPVIGTIHASKGREAPTVHLMLSEQDLENPKLDEETRILFVGATRARRTLLTGEGDSVKAGSLPSDRCYTLLPDKSGKPRAQIEIGREGDVDTTRQVARSLFASASDALAAQQLLRTTEVPLPITGYRVNQDSFLYHLRIGDRESQLLGALTKRVNDDIGLVRARRRKGGTQWPYSIPFINWVGVRTVCVSVDDPLLATLHPPFSESGFFLAPVIMAYTTITFPPKST